MNTTIVRIACALLLVMPVVSFSRQETSKLFSISPAEPKVGDQISLVYNAAAPGAKLKDEPVLLADVLIYRNHVSEFDNQPARIETRLEKDGDAWKGTFFLDEPAAKYMLIRVITASGDKEDNHDGRCWDALVHGGDRKPVRGACLVRGGYFAGWGQYIITQSKEVKDPVRAKGDFERELELYPGSYNAELDLANLQFVQGAPSPESKAAFVRELDRLSGKYKDNELALARIYSSYQQAGDSLRANAVRADAFRNNPKGVLERKARWAEIPLLAGDDKAKKISMQEKYFEDFPGLTKLEGERKLQSLFSGLVGAGEFDKAHGVLQRMSVPTGSLYNSLSWPLIEKGRELEKATGWAKQGVDLARNPDLSAKPLSVSRRVWEEGNAYELAGVLDTYGYGLFQLGKTTEAENACKEAFALNHGEDLDINNRYLECLVKNGKDGEAIRIGSECVQKDKADPRIVGLVRQAIVRSSGASAATPYSSFSSAEKETFETLLATRKRENTAEMRKKVLESRISKPSADFTLKSLEGKPVTLSSLKGKVVIVDFWATWCGPCKQSFPFLQKVYDAYKTNDQVAFLAIDCWERVNGYPATLRNAQAFIKENQYTFPVLIDEVSGKRVADMYEVEAIPTKFIIDRKGSIAFKSVGFDGPGMEEELTQQIELLLAEPMGALVK